MGQCTILEQSFGVIFNNMHFSWMKNNVLKLFPFPQQVESWVKLTGFIIYHLHLECINLQLLWGRKHTVIVSSSMQTFESILTENVWPEIERGPKLWDDNEKLGFKNKLKSGITQNVCVTWKMYVWHEMKEYLRFCSVSWPQIMVYQLVNLLHKIVL